MRRLLFATAFAVFAAAEARAVDLEIRFGVLERLLSEQAFTIEGKRYVRGDKDKKCDYAFLEKPRLAAVGGQVQLKVNFTGKTALNMFGKCVGLGDAFELTILATPIVNKDEVGFSQFQVSTPRDSYYIRRVRNTLVQTLNKELKLDIMAQARKLIEAPQQLGPFQQEIKDLRLTNVRVAPDALVLAVEFRVVVK
jgi:hypothetical protein